MIRHYHLLIYCSFTNKRGTKLVIELTFVNVLYNEGKLLYFDNVLSLVCIVLCKLVCMLLLTG